MLIHALSRGLRSAPRLGSALVTIKHLKPHAHGTVRLVRAKHTRVAGLTHHATLVYIRVVTDDASSRQLDLSSRSRPSSTRRRSATTFDRSRQGPDPENYHALCRRPETATDSAATAFGPYARGLPGRPSWKGRPTSERDPGGMEREADDVWCVRHCGCLGRNGRQEAASPLDQ